jgi:hypothetical protein
MPNTLLVDGDNLLTIGFFGLKNHFYKGEHIGAIYHFVNTLRRTIEIHHLDKIVVFWDGIDGSQSRKKYYHQYKENRKTRIKSEEEIHSYGKQRNRVKQYLEELFVRQGEYEYCETDDAVAYYSQHSPNENKIIFSSDGDLTQLVSENTKLFNPSHIKTQELSVDFIIERFNTLFNEDRDNKVVKNFLTGVTKYGVLGEEFFTVNSKVVSLEIPFLTDDARDSIHSLVNDLIDPEGRSYKNTMKMMMEDGIFLLLPKSDDAWIKFLNPFLRLTRKEKNKKIIKIKNNE